MHATLYCLDLSIAAKHVIYRSVCVCVCEEVQPPERSLDFLLVVCLFIHVCRISSLFPRSEVRLRNVFPLNKKKKYNVQLVQCQLGHSSFFWTCMPALKNHLSATFFSEVGKLGCAIGSISNINVFTFLSEKHLVKVMLSGKIQNTCFKTNHSSSIFPCRRGCSWPLPSFPGWHSLAGACVCVCPWWHEFDLIHFHLYLSVSHEAPPRPDAPGLPPVWELGKSWHTSDEH